MEVSDDLHTMAALTLRLQLPVVPIGPVAELAPESVWILWRGEKSPIPAKNQILIL